jgi:iron complex outermembrane receptor protein
MTISSHAHGLRLGVSVAVSAWVAIATQGSAHAQAAPAPAQPAASEQTGDNSIVVTARRREEALKDVPLAITALSGGQLKAANVTSLRDVANLTPGLIVTDGGAQFYSTPTIRGQAQLNTENGATENNVSVFLNGVYMANAGAINLSLLNLDRVEVVKGPVSSLYGRSAFAGAINYVTKAPTQRLTANVDATGGTYGRAAIDATVSGPITDTLRATIGGLYDRFDGTWKDDTNGNRAGGYVKKDLFGALQFEPGPTTKLTINGYYGKDRFDQPAESHLTNNCAFTPGGVATQFCGAIPQGTVIYAPNAASSNAAGNDREVVHFDATLQQDLGAGYKATLIGGYNNEKSRQFLEINNRDSGLTYNLVPGPGTANVNEYYGDDNNTRDYSAELRISSPQYEHVRFAVGAFYYHNTGHQTTNISLNQSQLPSGQVTDSFLANFWLTPGGVPSALRNDASTHGNQYSGFAEGEIRFNDQLSFAQEGRYTSDGKYILVNSSAIPGAGGFVPHTQTFDYWNIRSTLRYKPTPDVMVYISAANGTKSGGFNGRATVEQDVSYAPEKNWTYEAGVKGAAFDNRISYQAAVYHIDAKDLQILGPNHDPNNPGQVVANYGGSRNTGFEIESQTRLSPGLDLNLGFAYTDPKFTAGSYDAQYAGICALIARCAPNLTTLNGQSVINLNGYRLPRESNVQITAGLNLDTPLSATVDLIGRADYSFQSKQYFETANFSSWGPTHMVNLSAGIKKDRLTATIWVKNLLNQTEAYGALYNIRINDFVFETLPFYNDKRTVGATLSFKYQ